MIEISPIDLLAKVQSTSTEKRTVLLFLLDLILGLKKCSFFTNIERLEYFEGVELKED